MRFLTGRCRDIVLPGANRGAGAPIRQSPSISLCFFLVLEPGKTVDQDLPIKRDRIGALLRGRGITPTRQRVEIARVLFSGRRHLSADQVLAAVNARHAATSKATVYNTLNLFREKGLVREVIVDPSKVFYDPNTDDHHHFYDVVNGTLIDIAPGEIEINRLPPLPGDTTVEGVDIVVRIRSNPA
jgi:Fur family iron response transcriptional regulator